MFNLSIIVPATGKQANLDNTLVSVLENRPAHSEVIVPHRKDYQDPYDLSDEVTFVPTEWVGLAGLLNAGIAASHAEIVHLVLPGVEVSDAWSDAPVRRMQETPHLAAIAPLIRDTRRTSRLAGAGIQYTRGGSKRVVNAGRRLRATVKAQVVDGPLLQAAFIRRDVFEQVGWLTGRFGEYHIDTDFAARLRKAGQPCETTVEAEIHGVLPQAPRGFAGAKRAEALYRNHSGSTLAHACHVTWDALKQVPHPSAVTSVLGRCVARIVPVSAPSRSEAPPASTNRTESVTLSLEEARKSVKQSNDRNADRRYSKSA